MVIFSLTGIFAYQTYWLVGLYNNMHSEMERRINEAISISNYNEMALRMQDYAQNQNVHGAISVNASIGTSGAMQMQNTTIINDSVVKNQTQQGFLQDTLNGAIVLRPDKNNPQTQNFLNSLTNMLQSNLQSSIDALATPDIKIFTQLFSEELEKSQNPNSFQSGTASNGQTRRSTARHIGCICDSRISTECRLKSVSL